MKLVKKFNVTYVVIRNSRLLKDYLLTDARNRRTLISWLRAGVPYNYLLCRIIADCTKVRKVAWISFSRLRIDDFRQIQNPNKFQRQPDPHESNPFLNLKINCKKVTKGNHIGGIMSEKCKGFGRYFQFGPILKNVNHIRCVLQLYTLDWKQWI